MTVLVLGGILAGWLAALLLMKMSRDRERRVRSRCEEQASVFRLHAGRLAALLNQRLDLPPAAVDALADFYAYRREQEEVST